MRTISLFGYGKTTKAIASKIGHCTFYDDKVKESYTDENGYLVCPIDQFSSENSTLEIPSPGMPPFHNLIKSSKNLMSEYDYFADVMPYSIWISGTNGKTTTTQMVELLLKEKGAISGGNIGTPLADLDQNAPIWILETSSFTLHYTNKASPNIYLLLPITPDHLYWHGDMSEYEKAKLKPLESMKEGEVAILPNIYMDTPTSAYKIGYDTAEDLAEQLDIDISKIDFKGVFLLDAVMALAVEKILYDKIDYEKINSFKLDPHRQEELCDVKGRLWVNDSKATNVDATLGALKAYDNFQHIHIILGGDDKGVELEPLFDELVKLNVTIYTIGKNEERLVEMAKRYKIEFYECHTMHNAISMIDQNFSKGSIAMLSPAAASLDQFTSYVDRGDQFKNAICKLS